MSDVNYTLFETQVNNQPDDYQLQITADFSSANWDNDGQEILEVPGQNGGDLKVKLKYKAGSDGHVVHDFSIGDFPINISSWNLEVEFVDENGTKIKDKGQTAQAEIEARPRPITTFNS